MVNENQELLFNNALCDRTQQFREEWGGTQAQMALLLGVPVDRYRKYETRSPLPHYLVERFCIVVGCTVDELILGTPRKASARKSQSDRKRA